MKIIDLLNKIANGEEVPKKIKFCFRAFEYNDIDDYLCIDKNDYTKEDYCNGYSIHKWIFGSNLNDEIEIIEEDKKIEKIDTDELFICDNHEHIYSNFIDVHNKINEIIDYINKGD